MTDHRKYSNPKPQVYSVSVDNVISDNKMIASETWLPEENKRVFLFDSFGVITNFFLPGSNAQTTAFAMV